MSKKESNGRMDMTQGSPLGLIMAFSWPLILGNLLQQVYNMVDSVVVGNYVGKSALAAVGSGSPVVFMLASLFMGLGTGSTVMISQYFGAGDEARMKRTVDTVYTSMMVGAVPLSLIGVFLSAPLLRLLNVPEEIFYESWLYMVIIFAGMIGTIGYNINAGILQGLGDSKTPLLFLALACGINIVLDLLFVAVFRWGVAGVAIATIIAQAFSWVFGIFYINAKHPTLHVSPFCFRFDKELFRQNMRLGIPIGLQQALFSVGSMVQQSLVNSYGSDFIAGFNVANKVDMISFMPVQSFATAATTYVGQNIGAGRMDRVKSGTRAAILLSCAVSVIMALIVIPTGPMMIRAFGADDSVVQAGMAYLNRVMPAYVVFSVMFILNGVMRGAGEMTIPMISALVSLWLARVPLSYLFADLFGRDEMFYSYLVGWILGLLISAIYYFTGRWKKKALT
ncbi:MAG: MATE family efflux transporter [Oscillospiraceae bacterium]|nr:MATE family efflux transporter [Oscillospiraceae bacterium]